MFILQEHNSCNLWSTCLTSCQATSDCLKDIFWVQPRAVLCGSSGEQHTENLCLPPFPCPRWKESSTLAEGVERRVHCSIWSPLQSDHFEIIQVCSFIHAKTQTDWLTLSAAPVTQLYPWSQRFQVSHEHGCSGRSNPHALEQQLLLNLPGWKLLGSQRHWRVKHTHPARQRWPWVRFTYCWSSSARPGAVAHWAVWHHLLDHRQEDLASAWPDTAESRYAFSPLPAPSKDKRSFRPKGTCPHWLQVTLIQLLGCIPGQEPKPFLAGLRATAIWQGRNNSAVKELINQAESCLAALNFPSAICYIFTLVKLFSWAW